MVDEKQQQQANVALRPEERHETPRPSGETLPPYTITSPNTVPSEPTSPTPTSAVTFPRDTTAHGALPSEKTPQPQPIARQPTKPTAFERFQRASLKAVGPINKVAHLVGAETPVPSMDPEAECNKAARILYSFTHLSDQQPPKTNGPKHPTGLTSKSLIKIPQEVLRSCAGLAIFNVLRAGMFQGSLAGGSGVVIARQPDGSWSPPSSFFVSTIGAGLTFGVDIYDCVCVLNTPEQVRAFTNTRVSLGGDASFAVGPVGSGGSLEAAVDLKNGVRPVWTYMKSRGLWLGVQVDGTVVVTRSEANERWYARKGVTAREILMGEVATWPEGGKGLLEVLRGMDGREAVDGAVIERVVAEGPEAAQAEGGIVDEKKRLAQSGY